VNVRLRESESKTDFGELVFDSEELQVIGINRGKLGGILQLEGKDCDFGAFDIFREFGIGTFHLYPGFLPRDDSGWVLKPVENAVVNLLHDIVDGNGSAGILETTAAMITGCGGKQGSVGSQDVEAQKSHVLDQRNQGMKDLLIQCFSNTNAEVGKSSLTRDAIFSNTCQTPVVLSPFGISENKAEVFDGSDSIEIPEQVEKKKGNRIVAGPAKDGIGIGNNGANEREIDDGSYELRDAATNGTVVVDMDKLLVKFVMGKPASMFLGKWFTVTAVDERIDLAELSDKIANSKAGGFAHLKAPRVSREKVPPSNILPGNPFLLVNVNHPALQNPIQANASDPSISTNTGSTALRRLSCA
jgi:hypothetical protein